MARQEQDREDLLREATALVERVELIGDDEPFSLVVGFRRTGEGSLYWGADPVYQFNAAGELRRGFRAGKLLKAVQGNLVQLERQRTATESLLLSSTLDSAAHQEVLLDAQFRCDTLLAWLDAGRFRIVGQVPAERDVVMRVREWLRGLPRPLLVARGPHVRGAMR